MDLSISSSIISSCRNMFSQGKRREENSIKVKKLVKDSWNSGTVKFLLFFLPWHLPHTHSQPTSAYITNPCSGNLGYIRASYPQKICLTLIKPKESNKSIDLHPTQNEVQNFSTHRLLAIATHFLTFSVSSQEKNAVACQLNYKLVT